MGPPVARPVLSNRVSLRCAGAAVMVLDLHRAQFIEADYGAVLRRLPVEPGDA